MLTVVELVINSLGVLPSSAAICTVEVEVSRLLSHVLFTTLSTSRDLPHAALLTIKPYRLWRQDVMEQLALSPETGVC